MSDPLHGRARAVKAFVRRAPRLSADAGHAARFLAHVATGLLAVAAHWGTMALLLHLGVGAVAASAVGFWAGAAVRFVTAHRYVFSPTRSLRATAPRFALALAAQSLLNAGLLAALLALGWPLWLAQATTTVALAFATYAAYRAFVFR